MNVYENYLFTASEKMKPLIDRGKKRGLLHYRENQILHICVVS